MAEKIGRRFFYSNDIAKTHILIDDNGNASPTGGFSFEEDGLSVYYLSEMLEKYKILDEKSLILPPFDKNTFINSNIYYLGIASKEKILDIPDCFIRNDPSSNDCYFWRGEFHALIQAVPHTKQKWKERDIGIIDNRMFRDRLRSLFKIIT